MKAAVFNRLAGHTFYHLPVTIYQLPITIYQLPVFPLDKLKRKKALGRIKSAKIAAISNDRGLVIQSIVRPVAGVPGTLRQGSGTSLFLIVQRPNMRNCMKPCGNRCLILVNKQPEWSAMQENNSHRATGRRCKCAIMSHQCDTVPNGLSL